MTTIVERLQNLNINDDTLVTLEYSDGVDVFVHNETAVETAVAETDVVSQFCELVATPGLQAEDGWGNNILSELRGNGFLDDYERDYTFAEYLTDTVRENFYDLEFIEKSVESYDYKRGFCTLSTTVRVPVANFIEASPFVSGWNVSVSTENGTLAFDS